MSEEIKYFGEGVKQVNKMATHISRLISSKALLKNSIHLPFTYFLTSEQVRNLSNDDVTWPINVRVLDDKDIYDNVEYCAKITDLRKLTDNLAEGHEDLIFLISSPIQSFKNEIGEFHKYAFQNTTYFLANDYSVVYDCNRKSSIALCADNTSLFNLLELDTDYIYQLTAYRNRWFIEGIFPYADSRFSTIKSKSFIDLNEDEISEFRKGYLSVFTSGTSFGYIVVDKSATKYVTNPRYFGAYVGSVINNYLRNDFMQSSFNFGETDNNKIISYIINTDKNTLNRVMVGAVVHNAIVSNNIVPSEIEKDISKLFELYKSGFNFAQVSHCFGQISADMWRNSLLPADEVNSVVYNVPSLIVGLDKKIEFTKEVDFSCSGMQFRVTEAYYDRINIRLQTADFSCAYKVSINDGPFTYAPSSGGKMREISTISLVKADMPSEYNGDFEAYKKSIDELKFSLASQAGSTMVYAPLELKGDFVCSVETGKPLFSREKLIEVFKLAGYISAVNFNNVEGVFSAEEE